MDNASYSSDGLQEDIICIKQIMDKIKISSQLKKILLRKSRERHNLEPLGKV